MTELSRPWAGIVTGDAGPYTDVNWRQIFQEAIGHFNGANDGPLQNVLEELEVTVTGPASKGVLVHTGAALAQGTFYHNSADVTLAIADNASGQDRIDLIVLSADYVLQTVRAAVVQGVPAGVPVAPSPTQTAGVLWQIPLAEVEADNGFATIVAADIHDRREWANAPENAGARLVNDMADYIGLGHVVKLDTATDFAADVTVLESDGRVIDATIQGNADGENLLLPMHVRVVLQADAAVTRGALLASSTTAGYVTPAVSGAIAQALETIGGAGPVEALLLNKPVPVYADIKHDNSADYTTVSDALVDVDAVNLVFTLTTRGAPVMVYFAGMHTNTGGNDPTHFDVDIDGTTMSNLAVGLVFDLTNSAYPALASFAVLAPLAAGTHVFTLQWRRTAAGTATLHCNGELVCFGGYEL